MNHHALKSLVTVLRSTALLCFVAGRLQGEDNAKVQSSARPFGLSIVDEVRVEGTDSAAAKFDHNTLPSLRTMLNTSLQECQPVNDSRCFFDISNLTLSTAAAVRVYFIGEDAGYHNSLGFSAGTANSSVSKLIFPDASNSVSPTATSWNGVHRTESEPLLPGDFVDLGNFGAGTKLDFFLIADGAHGGGNTFSTNRAANPDHINHVVAFTTADSPYLTIGFEDLWGGGDHDYNDLMFSVDIGADNIRKIRSLTNAPEPALFVVLGLFLLPVWWLKIRRAALVSTSVA